MAINKIKLPKGSIIHVCGFPMELTADTEMLTAFTQEAVEQMIEDRRITWLKPTVETKEVSDQAS